MQGNYRTEFPAEWHNVPEMPEGFIDCSWGNDVCPHFELQIRDAGRVEIWVDAEDAAMREMSGKRFRAFYTGADEMTSEGEPIAESNVWDIFLTRVSEWLLALADVSEGTCEADLRAASTACWLLTEDGKAEVAADGF